MIRDYHVRSIYICSCMTGTATRTYRQASAPQHFCLTSSRQSPMADEVRKHYLSMQLRYKAPHKIQLQANAGAATHSGALITCDCLMAVRINHGAQGLPTIFCCIHPHVMREWPQSAEMHPRNQLPHTSNAMHQGRKPVSQCLPFWQDFCTRFLW